MSKTDIPAGYMRNAAGHLVPEDQVREHDKLRDQIAQQIGAKAVELNEMLKRFKATSLADVADVVRISAEKYGVALGGDKGNVSISTYDGSIQVRRQVAERITFTEEIEAAKALITSCIDRWSEGANPQIRALIDRAFRTDSKGQIKTGAVLELLRLDIADEEWKRAMEAIKDSIQNTGTATYLRVYRRVGMTDAYEAIPLDLAAV